MGYCVSFYPRCVVNNYHKRLTPTGPRSNGTTNKDGWAITVCLIVINDKITIYIQLMMCFANGPKDEV